ncbi:MAG: L-iditol 2-dehydrogenase [Gaiellales bacterium]|nr:L-iditol 2-dehydrogenase [Gaiellales bacterium]
MIAARFWAPRDVRLEHVAEPVPGPGEVVLRIEAALTCGTDAKCYRRGHPVLLGPAPAPFGHEYAGLVVACGEGAPFSEGDLVCGVNSAPCGECPPCTSGREELCTNLYPLLNGAYAEMLKVPAHIARVNLHRVPEGVPPEVAAAIEPLACAVHGADDAEAGPGQRIAILGRGPLGRLLALACDARGAFPELLGRGEGAPSSYDTVIEAAGTPEAWSHAIDLAAPGGTVVLFGGLPRETVVPVDSYRLHYEALTLRGSFHHRPRDVRAALALLERAASSIARVLTHEFALADVVEPLRRGAGLAPRDGLLKAVIRP